MPGIHDLAVATTSRVLNLDDLAEATQTDPNKFRLGLGQEQMSVPAGDEDVVTMAAAATQQILDRHGCEGIRTLYFATESGIDQSKSAGTFVHRLLGLPSSCRVVELKQACYSATAALQAAADQVSRRPEEKVLVIASDVARYDLESSAEVTQGAAAVALLVTADPAIAELEPISGVHTVDVDDFFRPNDSSTAVVEGKLSIDAYLDGMSAAWDDLQERGGPAISEIDQFCYHQPFTKMAVKAHRRLAEHTGADLNMELITPTTAYNRRIGNSYTASVYLALAAVLDTQADLAGHRIGLISYGSGSVSEILTLVVQPGYKAHTRLEETVATLDNRTPVDVAEYRALHAAAGRLGSYHDVEIADASTGPFHFAGVSQRARRYRRSNG